MTMTLRFRERQKGEFNDEYYVDEDALQKLIIELFYVEN